MNQRKIFDFFNEIQLYTHTRLGEIFYMQRKKTASVKTAVKKRTNGNGPDKKKKKPLLVGNPEARDTLGGGNQQCEINQ